MQLAYEFTVPVPPSEAWTVLLDLERVVPCLPGAALTSFDGESFVGTVRVKLGPVNLSYQGKGRFASRDEDAGRVVIEASGREARGGGTAAATATMTLRPGAEEASTVVTVQADLSVTGRPAQFGRGMIADVGGRLVGQFADCLAQRLAESRPATETEEVEGGGDGGAIGPESIAAPPVAGPPVDLLQVSAGPLARRVGPYAVAFLAGALVAWLLGRRG
ncbi:MAG TPA: SRPBCC family protein [Micromonosporaceae bacterium]|nr:SRPBCC family protein [Micromonosporaceae bacterium]